MTTLKQIWKCSVCGNVVGILHSGADSLICCGVQMGLQVEHKIEDEGEEKHVPVIEGKRVKVGSVAHPMEDGHYIEWIEGVDDMGISSRVFLESGGLPEAEFCFEVVSARVYCNLHGLWIS